MNPEDFERIKKYLSSAKNSATDEYHYDAICELVYAIRELLEIVNELQKKVDDYET